MKESAQSESHRRVLAIVVTYNRIRLLKKCVSALYSQLCACDILIINNASTDETEQFLKEESQRQSRLYYANMAENIGGAGGFARGMCWGIEKGYDYLWVMDDDCIPKQDSLTALLEADCLLGGSQHYGFLASTVLWLDGHECVMNRPKVVRSYYRRIELLKYGIIQIQQATFASALFPKETIQRFGLPFSEYFIWGDDIEYTRRIAWRGKVQSFLVGRSIVIHAMKRNTGSDIATDTPERIARYRLSYRNEFYTYKKHGFGGWICYCLRCLRGLYRIWCYAPDRKLKRTAALLSGIKAGAFFYPVIVYPSETSCEVPDFENYNNEVNL